MDYGANNGKPQVLVSPIMLRIIHTTQLSFTKVRKLRNKLDK